MTSIFVKKTQDTPTDWSFFVTVPEGFTYRAGQYSVMRIPLKYEDRRGNVRTCSTSSSPTEEYIRFTYTIRDSGFKRSLMEMHEGTEIDITPAKGKMTLEDCTTKKIVMIAGGIGVAPYRGMVKYAYDKKLEDLDITLLYSDKTIEELCYKAELDEIQRNYPPFKVIYTLTRHLEEHGEWTEAQGRINDEFIKRHILDLAEPTYMVCGPVEMVQSTMAHLATLGVPRERIIAELFTGY